jgi:hypothetical protein
VRSEYIQRMRDKRKLGQAQVGTRARRATRATGSSSAGPLQSESLLADCALASAPCRADRGTTANVARVYCESSTASADRPARGLPSWPCSLCASTVCRPRRGYASACTVAATRAAKREVGWKARSLEVYIVGTNQFSCLGHMLLRLGTIDRHGRASVQPAML